MCVDCSRADREWQRRFLLEALEREEDRLLDPFFAHEIAAAAVIGGWMAFGWAGAAVGLLLARNAPRLTGNALGTHGLAAAAGTIVAGWVGLAAMDAPGAAILSSMILAANTAAIEFHRRQRVARDLRFRYETRDGVPFEVGWLLQLRARREI